ncbi:MAG: DNA recombination protein RmuC [Firmicutes bacterium]|nr:DNA recombination protein RmuC [Bacillota bacterium]
MWVGVAGLIVAAVCLMQVTELRRQLREKQRTEQEREQQIAEELRSLRQELMQYVQVSFKGLGDLVVTGQQQSAEQQDRRLAEMSNQLNASALQSEQRMEHMRQTVEQRLVRIQEDNEKRLDEIRMTVDEKLQKTLEDRIGQSFQLVSQRLEQVYKGLGEMQTLASGVGDLKKVLSNVKTRGILGEVQLSAILEQILSPQQYDTNVVTRPNSRERVEFAVRLPGEGDRPVYLPIDAKFPADTFARLDEAYDRGEAAEIAEAGKIFELKLRSFARDIHEKYVEPPYTTDFAIMFLPVESIYAEAVRRGMVETLQKEYKINIAGPTTMAALLNSLQMGFQTLAIQKRSSQVWDVLGAVKTEFDKFGTVLAAAQQRLNQANSELDKLVGVRTRKIQRQLRDVTALPDRESQTILDGYGVPEIEPEDRAKTGL